MMGLQQPIPALQRFVSKLEAIVQSSREDDPSFMTDLGQAMRELVARDDWLPESVAVPHPQFYQQYSLYVDPQERFSVVSFVWGPGQQTPIHDHTVWGVIGQLRGAEVSQAYRVDSKHPPQPYGDPGRLEPGDVAFVSPRIGDVHKVANAYQDRVSISIHAYGANIGKVNRHVFPPEGGPAKSFVSGYSAPVESV